VRVIPYRKVSELDGPLREYLAERQCQGFETCCIVPSRRDRDWWRKRSGRDSFGFGISSEREIKLWNWEDLYGDVCSSFDAPRLRQVDPPSSRLIMAYVVNEFLKDNEDITEAMPGLKRPGFLDVLATDVRELMNEAVTPENFAILNTPSVLPELYRRCLAYHEEHGLMDSASIPTATLKLLSDMLEQAENWSNKKRFAFVGFMSFTRSQRRLVDKLEALSKDVVIFEPAAGAEGFQDAAKQFDLKTPPPAERETGVILSLRSADYSIEQEMIARRLALWSAGAEEVAAAPFPGFGDVGIMTPQRRAAAMEAALRRYKIPCSPARGRAVSDTIVGKALAAVRSAWVSGLDTHDTALLLTQLWTGAPLSLDGVAQAGPRGADGWSSFLAARQPALLGVFGAMVKLCRAVDRGALPVDLLTLFHGFLTAGGSWLSTLAPLADSHPDLDESVREIAASINELEAQRDELRERGARELGPAAERPLSGAAATDFLMNWCAKTRVPPPASLSGSVVLYSDDPPVLASHPVWIMTGVTRREWPGIIPSSPLLDAEVMDALSDSAPLPSAHDKRVQREALFRRLLRTGDCVTIISRSDKDEEGRSNDAPFLVDAFLSDAEKSGDEWKYTETAVGDDDFYFPEIEPEEGGNNNNKNKNKNKKTPRLAYAVGKAGKITFPVGDLFELLDCPFRWAVNRRVRLRDGGVKLLDAELFGKDEAGILTHKLWEGVWRRWHGESIESIASLAERELAENGEISASRLFSDRRLSRMAGDIKFYVARLASLQDDILGRIADSGRRLVAVETEFTLPPREVDGVTFTGRCDRRDLFDDGSAVIIDYKLGKSASYEKGIKRLNFKFGLQLSAYALMNGICEAGCPGVAGVGFMGHKDGGLAGTFEGDMIEIYLGAKKKPVSLAERAEEANSAMQQAATLLKSGLFTPNPDADACRYCSLKGLCRRGEVKGERPEDEDAEEAEEA
jgi:RecB family exonuclease